ncbi:MAG: hypothetical protein HY903_16190 [Deltaproteobacteria bacterium]|nr:hypothetical protein [Deltaproteobacteria bacterium]
MSVAEVRFESQAVARAFARYAGTLGALGGESRARLLALMAEKLRAVDHRDLPDENTRALEAARVVAAFGGVAPGRSVLAPPAGAGFDPSRVLPLCDLAALSVTDCMPLANGRRPATLAELNDAFYLLAAAIDAEPRANVLARLGTTHKAELVRRVEDALAGTSFPKGEGGRLGAAAAMQLRSSAATVLVEICDSLLPPKGAAERRLLRSSLDKAASLARAESFAPLRAAMVFGLYRLQGRLPAELCDLTRALVREVAPVRPAYDEWLKDGKVGVEMVIDDDFGTIDKVRAALSAQHFVETDHDPPTFERTVGSGAKAASIEIKVWSNQKDLFEAMDAGETETDVIWFFGHSERGRAVLESLVHPPKASGKDKLAVLATCFGKEDVWNVQQAFPEAQVAASFRSVFDHEVTQAMGVFWDAIGKRRSWASISKALGGPEKGNWLTPADALLRHRLMDRDGDGRADIFDRLFDVSLTKSRESRWGAFTPRAPRAPPHRLAHQKGVAIAAWLNRGPAGTNDVTRHLNEDSRVTAAGFFAGAPGDRPVRFAAMVLADGRPGFALQVNDHFAHMPEEAMRAVAAYELNSYLSRYVPQYPLRDDPLRAGVNGLMVAAFSLDSDSFTHDASVWASLLCYYGLPEEISAAELLLAAKKFYAPELHNSAGGEPAIAEYLANLRARAPGVLARLEEAMTGAAAAQTPAAVGLPVRLYESPVAVVEHGGDPGNTYCEHVFFLAQEAAHAADSAVVTNRQGEKLVGFLHVPRDVYTGSTRPFVPRERYAGIVEVVGAGLSGYVREVEARVPSGPVRVLLSGFGPFADTPPVVSNATGDFVSHPENVDRAMRRAFGANLQSPKGREVKLANGLAPPARLLEYDVVLASGLRSVQILCLPLATDDTALDPASPTSLTGALARFRAHAVLSMGSRAVFGNTFIVEHHADADHLDLTLPPESDAEVEDGVSLADNYSLARAILGALGR